MVTAPASANTKVSTSHAPAVAAAVMLAVSAVALFVAGGMMALAVGWSLTKTLRVGIALESPAQPLGLGGRPIRAGDHQSPLLLYRGLPKEYSRWQEDMCNGQSGVPFEALPDCITSELRTIALRNDMISPSWIQRSGEWMPDAYMYLRNVNPNVYILEYANTRNIAANIFASSDTKEEWYLHMPLGEKDIFHRVVTPFTVPTAPETSYNEWVYDLGSQEFVSFFVDRAKQAIAQGADGFWMDNAGIRYWQVRRYDAVNGSTAEKEHRWDPLNPRTGTTYTTCEQYQEIMNIAVAVRAGVDQAFPDGSISGKPIVMSPNVGDVIIQEEACGIDGWDLAATYGAVQSESGAWFASHNGPYYHTKGGITPLTIWQRQLADVKTAMEKGLAWVYMGKQYREGEKLNADWEAGGVINEKGEYVVPPWPNDNRMLFTYASILLAAGREEDRFYLRYNVGELNDWEGFDQPIGFALGDDFIWPDTQAVYAREFERALVIVNPTPETVTIDPARKYPGIRYQAFVDRTVNRDGWVGLGPESSSPITLAGRTAAILFVADGLAPRLFMRGDTNDDGVNNLSDAMFILNHLFFGGPSLRCLDAADVNDDGIVNIADPGYLLKYLFTGEMEDPPFPFAACGADPTQDILRCASFPRCQR